MQGILECTFPKGNRWLLLGLALSLFISKSVDYQVEWASKKGLPKESTFSAKNHIKGEAEGSCIEILLSFSIKISVSKDTILYLYDLYF